MHDSSESFAAGEVLPADVLARFEGPHQHERAERLGPPPDRARAGCILIHGRGASARSILELAGVLQLVDVAYVAPQAAGYAWYPFSFLAPLAQNEPGLTSGLRTIHDALAGFDAQGLPPERTVLMGFSQGACLASEFVARYPRRYGGLAALSGALIGTGPSTGAPSPDDKTFDAYTGDLAGMPVFIGCSDVDAHIPVERVHRSADVLEGLGGAVTKRIYPGMGHTIVDDEIRFVRSLFAALVAPPPDNE